VQLYFVTVFFLYHPSGQFHLSPDKISLFRTPRSKLNKAATPESFFPPASLFYSHIPYRGRNVQAKARSFQSTTLVAPFPSATFFSGQLQHFRKLLFVQDSREKRFCLNPEILTDLDRFTHQQKTRGSHSL
jgi:hypothetical protein